MLGLVEGVTHNPELWELRLNWTLWGKRLAEKLFCLLLSSPVCHVWHNLNRSHNRPLLNLLSQSLHLVTLAIALTTLRGLLCRIQLKANLSESSSASCHPRKTPRTGHHPPHPQSKRSTRSASARQV